MGCVIGLWSNHVSGGVTALRIGRITPIDHSLSASTDVSSHRATLVGDSHRYAQCVQVGSRERPVPLVGTV